MTRLRLWLARLLLPRGWVAARAFTPPHRLVAGEHLFVGTYAGLAMRDINVNEIRHGIAVLGQEPPNA